MKTKIADAIRAYIAETNPIASYVQRAANWTKCTAMMTIRTKNTLRQ